MKSPVLVVLAAAAAMSAPAFAQTTFQAPRFDALEQQKATMEQNHVDALQKKLEDERARALTPKGSAAAAQSAVAQMQLQQQIQRSELQYDQERAAIQRENVVTQSALPNRRIAASSVLVVGNPVAYALPPAPKGHYYARVDGRFVLVDAASELVVKVLEPQPTDPTADVPQAPASPPQPAIPRSPPGQRN